jgi:phosphatidylserine/phosphatidylglycerophosphate/cardiolipin synthase-like enzyme
MHHKFVILDGAAVLTGSYNWTTESEEQNYENLVILSDPAQVRTFQEEFEELWREAENKA